MSSPRGTDEAWRAVPPFIRPLLLVPAWNERDVIASTLRQVRDSLPTVDILVVDDGSTDQTAQIATACGAEVLILPYNLGLGGALRAGFKYAQRNGYDAVVQFDADGQHRPGDVPTLLEGLATHDLVIGSRFTTHSNTYHVQGPRRWAMMWLANTLSKMAGTPITDPTSGMRAISKRLLPLFAEYYPADYLENVEAMVMTLRAGFTVTERPVTMLPRQGGTASQSPVKLTFHMIRTLLILGLSIIRRWPAAPSTTLPIVPSQRSA